MRLWIIRHAKSSWADPGQADFERGLSARGRRDGPAMAAWLAKQSHAPTWIWSSTAVRALATAEFVASGFGVPVVQMHTTDDLYHASPEAVIEVLRQTPAEHKNVAVVAHNPGLTQLVNLLVGESVTANLPTFGVAELTLPERMGGDWLNLVLPSSGQLARQTDDENRFAALQQLESPKTIG